jgi:hypothetical protein
MKPVHAEPISLIRYIHKNPHPTRTDNPQAHLMTRNQYYSRHISITACWDPVIRYHQPHSWDAERKRCFGIPLGHHLLHQQGLLLE